MQEFEHLSGKMDHEDQKGDISDLVSSSNEKVLDTLDIITLEREEGSEFQEGGIRGWATVLGA